MRLIYIKTGGKNEELIFIVDCLILVLVWLRYATQLTIHITNIYES